MQLRLKLLGHPEHQAEEDGAGLRRRLLQAEGARLQSHPHEPLGVLAIGPEDATADALLHIGGSGWRVAFL